MGFREDHAKQMGDDCGYQKKFIRETSEHISDLGVQRSKARLVPVGTLLMSFKLSLGSRDHRDPDVHQ